jgi:hypothetical protein
MQLCMGQLCMGRQRHLRVGAVCARCARVARCGCWDWHLRPASLQGSLDGSAALPCCADEFMQSWLPLLHRALQSVRRLYASLQCVRRLYALSQRNTRCEQKGLRAKLSGCMHVLVHVMVNVAGWAAVAVHELGAVPVRLAPLKSTRAPLKSMRTLAGADS